MEITDKKLREYCKYMIDIYKTINVEKWESSGFYFKLEQFMEELRVKDIVFETDSNKSKSRWLDLIGVQILVLSEDVFNRFDVKIKTFKEYFREYKLKKLLDG